MDESRELGGEDVRALALNIEAKLVAKLNLADFQNAIPLIRELVIANELDTKAGDLELSIASIPPFLKPKVWHIDSIGVGQRYLISDLDVKLDGSLFLRLTEAEKATVEIVLRSHSKDAEVARLEVSVELLPRNQWGGLVQLPEMVAAFVQPNDPAVERLLKQAADVLRKNGKSPALDGYKGGPKRAWELASGIWSAVAGMGLDYALPPASFEQTGQKVRGPGQIAESGLATCLDLSLLFSAALEQAGLNPLLVFIKDHVFTGVWLKSEEFSTVVVDDITALRKRVKLNELVLFETTLITQRPAPIFSYAALFGAQQISEEKEAAFELAVDIRRARMQRIKPLASVDVAVMAQQAEPHPLLEPVFEDAPDLPEEDALTDTEPSEVGPEDRLARWQRKLLDLSLRNNLLNFKGGKKGLKLEVPDPESLEDLLSDGQSIKLLPMPDLMNGADPRNQVIYEGREREDVRRGHAQDALKRREVFVIAPEEELETRLVEIYRGARSTLQEGGANTLFLAIGFLTWTREDKAGQRYRAPLVLVPVTLNRRSARSGFTLTLHDDEPRFNPTLLEMLRQDYNLNLGVADGELPKDNAGLDIAGIWKSVSHAIKDIKGWEVNEDVVLAMFSFAKYLMWKDLTERTDQLRENPVVRHLIDTPRDTYLSTTAFPNPKRLDVEYRPEQSFCPLPADSSQLSAVLAAAKGKDFVLIGPPGTGKSQTISNLIAQSLAEGKRVLFVSEKIAALEVVYRRLREVGLGEFCLELHSNKARKLDVLTQLQRAWEAQGDIDQDAWRAEADRLKKLRDNLNVYVARLHLRHPNGLSIFDAIGRVVEGEKTPKLGLTWSEVQTHSIVDVEVFRELADRLEVNARAVGRGALVRSPLSAITHSDWSPLWQRTLIDAVTGLLPAITALEQAYERFSEATGLPRLPLDRRARGAIGVLARILPDAAGRDLRFVLMPDAGTICEQLKAGAALLVVHRQLTSDLSPAWPDAVINMSRRGLQLLHKRREIFTQLDNPWPQDVIEDLKKGLALLEAISSTASQLSVQYSDQVEKLDVIHLQRDWLKAEKSIWPMSWARKRKIRAVLDAAVQGEGEPDIQKDLQTHIRIRELRSKATNLGIEAKTEELWAGLKTRAVIAQVALRFQLALREVKHGGAWKDVGFEAIAQNSCGHGMAKALAGMRLLKELDAEVITLQNLTVDTFGLWNGLDTQEDRLEAALQFQVMVGTIREAGALSGEHESVATGDCGAPMALDLQKLRQRNEVEQKLNACSALRDKTVGLWNDLNTRMDEITNAIEFQAHIAVAIANLADAPKGIDAVKASLGRLLGEGNILLEPSGPIVAVGKAYLSALAVLRPIIDRIASAASFSEESKAQFSELTTTLLAERCNGIIQAENRLNAWCAWLKVREQALAKGLAPLVRGIEDGRVAEGAVRQVFETDYCRWWLNVVVEQEEVIRTFVSAEHEKRIGDFRALDDRFTELTRSWVRARLCAGLPDQEGVAKSSEWGTLRHEMNKKKRHLPLRELMARIPSALTRLTPCLLMSPLSIAQYLAADSTAFDLVVFDEASQIPVWDAIGAIARGKQVVMVGDPKQLPPTNFFNRAESDADDEDVEGDLESILDECLGASLPTLNLAWHYRSRNESLIAFSNHHYYGGALVTFPSPATKDGAVSFHHVNGIYEKGGARINKPEAKALVADLVSRLKSPGFRASKLTIGVVTFNTEQQTLIEDLLDDERRKNPIIEPYFSDGELEPIFVKNLESVQGDERDIMYFSITYGPNLTGAVSMNFGPMNREGGERRLNVAITRARHELRVFSSLKAEQMDLARTQAIGVRDLKFFLDFAERGPRALAEATSGGHGDFESPFEEAVASMLKTKGWELNTQVGVSAFRIDLAVIHPDAPGTYLAGIECDGATYHRSATARDRDKLREQVLRGLGWEILRIWSTDWWIDRVGTLDRLHVKLITLLESSRAKRAEALEQETAYARSISDLSHGNDDDLVAKDHFTVVAGTASAVTDYLSLSEVTSDSSFDQNSPPAVTYARNGSTAPVQSMQAFVEADLSAFADNIDPESFFDNTYSPVLMRMITSVIEVEGPILGDVLARRIARCHGWQRTGTRILERVEGLAAKTHDSTKEEVGIFYWSKVRGPGKNIPFRRPAVGSGRLVDEVCMSELISLAKDVMVDSADVESGIVAMARELGLQRLRAASRGRFELAMRLACENGSDNT